MDNIDKSSLEAINNKIKSSYMCYVAEYNSKIIGTICLYAPNHLI